MIARAIENEAEGRRLTPSPSFSIVIPTYQRRDIVCEAVKALCAQSFDGTIEIIVVIDGSTDRTKQALSAVECRFPVRLVEQQNRGLAAARNRGAAEAVGDIILFLDDDLIAEPDLIRQHAQSHMAGADAVTGEIPIDPKSRGGIVTDRLTAAASWKRGATSSAFDVYGGHLSIRREAFEQVGGFDEDLHAGGYGGEDLDFGLRLSGRYEVRHNPDAIARQRNLIGPLEHMRRARKLAASDLRLIAKHPAIAAELLSHRGFAASAMAPLAMRLSRIALLPSATASAAALLAEIAQRTSIGSRAWLARLYFTARSALYWSTFRRLGGAEILRRIADTSPEQR